MSTTAQRLKELFTLPAFGTVDYIEVQDEESLRNLFPPSTPPLYGGEIGSFFSLPIRVSAEQRPGLRVVYKDGTTEELL